MLGNFENGNPYIEIEIKGISDEQKKLKALIDTGFNGYLTLPYIEAFPLGLVLTGIQSSRLADGSISHHFVCIGTVIFDGKKITTPIDIQPECTVLIGTQLLKKLEKELHINFLSEKVEFI